MNILTLRNCSGMHVSILHRSAHAPPRTFKIPAFDAIEISDLSEAEIAELIAQNGKYGLRHVSDVQPDFCGVWYDIRATAK